MICISGAFTFTGFYRLSNKVLEHAKGFTDKNNFQELFPLEVFKLMHNFYSGNWDGIHDADELLIDENLKTGQFFNLSGHFYHLGLMKIYQGKYSRAYPLIEKLSNIADNYEYKIARQYLLFLEIALFLSRRKLNDAQQSIETYESIFKAGSDMATMAFLGPKTELQILLHDFNGAEKTLRQAEEIFAKQVVVSLPFAIIYFRSRLLLDVKLLEESIFNDNKAGIKEYGRQASTSSKKLWQNAKKFPAMGSLDYGLIARYYWLMGKQNRAIKLWKRALEEGKRLGARPDLARTYMEIGKCLLEEKSKYKELNAIGPKEYLEKARTKFQEMDLQWDLDELDKISIP